MVVSTEMKRTQLTFRRLIAKGGTLRGQR